ncbi:MAG: class I adenylate-forming enzyme family protein [Rhodospirillales bacterium]|nr:class I adenylate-forming enzyme family protein [Rhodospirillales bacterium]
METITDAATRHGLERPGGAALADDRFRLSWAEAVTWMEATAGWLVDQGFARGRPVVAWLPNCVEWNLLRLACERGGYPFIPVPASQGMREMTSILERMNPALLVSKGKFRRRDYQAEGDEICASLAEAPARLTLPESELPQLLGPAPAPETALGLDEMVHALPTSGSEGIPKIGYYTGQAAGQRALGQIEILGLKPDDKFLVLSHGPGPARPAWLGAPMAGACIHAMPIFSAEKAVQLIASEKPSLVCATPAQLAMMAPDLDEANTASIRIWYTSGAVMPASLADELESISSASVVSTYGGADFGGWACPAPDDPPHIRRHTVGKARGGSEFRLVDDQGQDVPKGETGQLIGRGPCCVEGYLGEAGRDSWQDGWFQTGDLASRDDAGNISIIGRVKNVILRGGDNVIPIEIEALLRTHPDIAQLAVVGVPDPVLGERVCACVVPRAGKGLELDPLRQYLLEQGISHYKVPERMIILEDLPIVGDKVDLRTLGDLAARMTSEAAG